MKYTFKIETDDIKDLADYQQAELNSYIVWELKHNFFRKFKHLDKPEEFIKGVDYVLDELIHFINNEHYNYNE